MALYSLGILGCPSSSEREALTRTLEAKVAEFDMALGRDVILHHGPAVGSREKRHAFAATYFGGAEITRDSEVLGELIRSNAPILPTVSAQGDFSSQIPEIIHPLNGLRRRGDDPHLTQLATALLECIGLLRRQRRVFISYRRVEARSAALQLHDLLAARAFDAFLDTHDILPGDPFQDVLWHRLVDSDVVVMLDTPTYFQSRWTREEIARTLAKDILILRVIWPDRAPTPLAGFSESIYLGDTDLDAPEGPIVDEVADAIVLRVENLRSKSIAARYMAITGKLRADVEKIGGSVDGVGAHRSVAVRLPDNRRIWAYPVVGVPTAETLYDIAVKARAADQDGVPVLVYDHVGIRDTWKEHLEWLDSHIRVVRSIKVSEAGWQFAAWNT